jgi:hypothetical protein
MSRLRRLPRPALKIALGGAGALVLLVGVLVVWLLVQRNRAVTLPAPTGPYAVGRADYDWVDPAREDPFAPPGTRRELLVWVWYPAALAPGAAPAPYLPEPFARLRDREPWSLFSQRPQAIRVHAVAEAPVAAAADRLPVLVFEPGLGRAPVDYTTLAEELASHGYVVAGIFPTASTEVVFPDGHVARSVDAARDAMVPDQLIALWSGDVRFALDRLTALEAEAGDRFAGRLDLGRVGVFGHSFGGATAAEACRLDRRCKAGADLDGTPYGPVARAGLPQPFLFVRGDEEWDPEERPGMAAIVRSAPTGHGAIMIHGARHFNFADTAVTFAPMARPLGALGPIDGARGLRIAAAYLEAFFDHALNGADAPLLAGPSPAYPEVEFLAP